MISERIKRRGSAYLIVFGALSVLTIIVIFFLRANSSRRFTTRMMSDEKKAEALAESAVDLVMSFYREKMNDSSLPDYYLPFRYPCELPIKDLGDNTGKNIPLDMKNYSATILDLENDVSALKPLEYIIKELGGTDNVKLRVSVSVIHAEALSAKRSGYEVVGISEAPKAAKGLSAQFYDSRGNLGPSASDGKLSDIQSTWKLDFKLPDGTYKDKHRVYLPEAPDWTIKRDDVEVERKPPYDTSLIVHGDLYIHVDAVIKEIKIFPDHPSGSMTVDVMEKISDYVGAEQLPDGSYKLLSMESLRDQAMEGDHTADDLKWYASGLIAGINTGWNNLQGPIKDKINSNPYGNNPQVIEKTGVLQIKAEVEYWPNGPEGKKIDRTLVANRPFKVSDVQPPAPEYSFFVANSNLLFEGDDNPMGVSLGNPINWSPTYSVASICIHNLHGGEYESMTGLEGPFAGGAQIPGMVRINSRQEMKINTYLGTKEQPYLTEFNALVNKLAEPNYKVLPKFRWNDSPLPNSQYEVHFPVIVETSLTSDWPCTGFENLINFLSVCNALEGPSQFFGKCFMEYPLGMVVEAALKQKYGTTVFQVKPKGQEDEPHDISEIRVTYINKEKKYGIEGKPGYTSAAEWSPDSEDCKPPNVYSLLQYAKKATHFYASEAEFWADGNRFQGGAYDCTGVTYIRGSLTISGSDAFKVKGRGILVVKDNIAITCNVLRQPDDAGEDAVFTLMARSGYLDVSGSCNLIQASCFSNYSPMIDKTTQLVIDGNLVVNEFDRGDVDYLEINYNSAACRVSPLSVMRDVGKYDPKRYIVSVADNWSSYKFEKIKAE